MFACPDGPRFDSRRNGLSATDSGSGKSERLFCLGLPVGGIQGAASDVARHSNVETTRAECWIDFTVGNDNTRLRKVELVCPAWA